MKQPELSVIILNYNTFELTSNCIRSVLAQTQEVSFEIILVDNGSSECAPEKFTGEFPSVKLVASQKNLGFAAGNNLGIAQSSGEIILLLNSDTELAEDAISACYSELKQQPKTGIITCKLQYPDGKIQRQCQRFPSVFREFLLTFRLLHFFPAKQRASYFLGPWFDHLSSCEPDWVWGAFFMFRRKTLELFPQQQLPETYFMYGEDLEWCWHFRQKGWRVFYKADSSVIHHLGKSSAARNTKAMFANEKDFIVRTKGRFYWKLYKALRMLNYRLSGAHYREIRRALKQV